MTVISTARTTGITLGANDPLFVTATGSVIAPTGGISTLNTANYRFSILGFVEVNTFMSGNTASVSIGASGHVGLQAAEGLQLGYAASLGSGFGHNSLTVGGELYGAGIATMVYGDRNVVTVTGHLEGALTGVRFLGALGNRLLNSGTIVAQVEYGVYSFSELRLDNSGLISGGYSGVLVAAKSQLTNSGQIEGAESGMSIIGTGSTVTNTGLVTGTLSGIFVAAGNVFIDNGSLGEITGQTGISIIEPGAAVTNAGRISGGQHGITVDGDSFTLTNSGTVTAAESVAVKITAATSGSGQVTNSGTISGQAGALTAENMQGMTLLNTGTITGTLSGINISGTGVDGFYLTNTGTIATTGVVALQVSGLDTVLVNSGTIRGAVFLGGGDDIFQNQGGTVMGSIWGGNGSDTYYVDRSDLSISEGEGNTGDVDAVFSSVDWALSFGFETLTLTGLGALQGIGNSAGNGITGNAGDNRLSGLGGDDTLDGGDGDDVLRGGAGNDLVTGADGDDRLLGQAGVDTLSGGDGMDTLVGGVGRDFLTGGADADVFVFGAGDTAAATASADFISDFVIGTDRIDLSAIDAKPATGVNDAFTFVGAAAFTAAGQVHVIVSGGRTYVEYETTGDNVADGIIRISGPGTLLASDFVL